MPSGPHPVILQEAFLKIIDNKNCNAPYALSDMVSDTMLCAGYMSGEADACQVCLSCLPNHFLSKYQLNGSCCQHKIFLC
jgi:hypothetical protein